MTMSSPALNASFSSHEPSQGCAAVSAVASLLEGSGFDVQSLHGLPRVLGGGGGDELDT